MINVKNAEKVLDAIQSHRDQFRYDVYFCYINPLMDDNLKEQMKCGTAGCIAGWTLAVLTPEISINDALNGCPNNAAELLGLTKDEMWFLFIYSSDYANVDDAIARLKWLIDGKDWKDYDYKNESWNFREDISEESKKSIYNIFKEE